jgi:hypothetical protein
VQGVNNVQICLIPAFSSLTTKLGRWHPNVCTAETGSQLLTATARVLYAVEEENVVKSILVRYSSITALHTLLTKLSDLLSDT